MVPSPQVATYNLQPEMSAPEVTAKVVEAINSGTYDVIILNYANPDMVGHTGVFEAALEAVETVDKCLGEICDVVFRREVIMLITADHGNVETMVEDGCAHTAHTTDEVPLILVSDRFKESKLREGGALEDVAPTILSLLGIPKPGEMTGRTLIRED